MIILHSQFLSWRNTPPCGNCDNRKLFRICALQVMSQDYAQQFPQAANWKMYQSSGFGLDFEGREAAAHGKGSVGLDVATFPGVALAPHLGKLVQERDSRVLIGREQE